MVLRAVLKLTRHRACRIAASVPDIEVHAVATAGYRTAVAISPASCCLIFGRYHAVRITATVNVNVIAISAVLNLVQVALARGGPTKLSNERCGREGNDH